MCTSWRQTGEDKYSSIHPIPQPYMEMSFRLRPLDHSGTGFPIPKRVGPTAGLNAMEYRKISCSCQKPNHHFSVIQPLSWSLLLPTLTPNTNLREGKFNSLTLGLCTLNTQDNVRAEVYMGVAVSFWNSVTSCESNRGGAQMGILCAICGGNWNRLRYVSMLQLATERKGVSITQHYVSIWTVGK